LRLICEFDVSVSYLDGGVARLKVNRGQACAAVYMHAAIGIAQARAVVLKADLSQAGLLVA